jgi:citrate lyase synthetase
LVPQTTFEYLISEEAKTIIGKIKNEKNKLWRRQADGN